MEHDIPFTVQINVDWDNYNEVEILVDFILSRFNRDCPILLNEVLHSEKEIPTNKLLTLFAQIKKNTGFEKLYVNSVVAEKIIDLLLENGISSRRCNVCNTRVYDFTEKLIYCCPQLSHTVIGKFDFEKEGISAESLSLYINNTAKNKEECQCCELRCFCEFGCIDDNPLFKNECKNNTILSIQTILENIDLFLDFVDSVDENNNQTEVVE